MKVSLTYSENLHFKASVRQFSKIDIDEPESFHGTDLGPSSVEYFLIGIAGCLVTTFAYCFQRRQIGLNDLKITADGKISHIGTKRRLRLVTVDIEIHFALKDNNSPKEKVNRCIKEFKEFCVVTQSIQNGFPINVNCINSQDI